MFGRAPRRWEIGILRAGCRKGTLRVKYLARWRKRCRFEGLPRGSTLKDGVMTGQDKFYVPAYRAYVVPVEVLVVDRR